MTQQQDTQTSRDRMFAARLPELREARGFPVARDLSAALRWPSAVVSRIERGQRRVTVGEAAHICLLLGVDLSMVMDPATPLPEILARARERSP